MDEQSNGIELTENERVNFSLIAQLGGSIEVFYCAICHQPATDIILNKEGRRLVDIYGALCEVHSKRFGHYLEQRESN